MERFEGGCRRLGGQLLLELREVCDFPVLGELAVSDPVELKSREIDTIAGRLDLPKIVHLRAADAVHYRHPVTLTDDLFDSPG